VLALCAAALNRLKTFVALVFSPQRPEDDGDDTWW
jgi:hypothetical protein